MKEFTSVTVPSSLDNGKMNMATEKSKVLSGEALVEEIQSLPYWTDCGQDVTGMDNCISNSVGSSAPSISGCNVNNSQGSARTLNANNALSNGNSNYAGAFAIDQENRNTSARSTRTNMTEQCVVDVHTQNEAHSLSEDLHKGVRVSSELHDLYLINQLKIVNSKRKLTNLKRFIINPVIVDAAIDRCYAKAAKSPAREQLIKDREFIKWKIIYELSTETYKCGKPTRRVIKKKHNDGKDRIAEIYFIYDRVVQNIVYLVLSPKLNNCIYSHCYSGIRGKSMFANNRQFSMANRIKRVCINNPDSYAGTSDIEKFYNNLSNEVVFGCLIKTIKCPFTQRLIWNILSTHETLPIGGTLSQMFAMFVLSEMDKIIRSRFKLAYYGAFGDNRIFIGDKSEVIKALHFEAAYLEGRYNLSLKGDYSLRPVSSGFRFCKYDFFRSYIRVRTPLKKRAIKAFYKGKQNYAGYLGIFYKTDSKVLNRLIMEGEIRAKNGIRIHPSLGKPFKMSELVGKDIQIVNAKKIKNNRPSEYYYSFQFLIRVNGEVILGKSRNGSFLIKEFFDSHQGESHNIKTKVLALEGRESYYFEGYSVSLEEATDILTKVYNF